MERILIDVRGNQINVPRMVPITTGSARVYPVEITFDATWDGLSRTVVFEAGEAQVEIILGPDNRCTVPWEPLVAENVGKPLLCGVYGTDGAGTRLPTVWATISPGLLRGTAPGGPALEPTPGVYEQMSGQLGDLERRVGQLEGGGSVAPGQGGGISASDIDDTLVLRDGVLGVNTADVVEEDNTRPITSAATPPWATSRPC